MCTAFLHWTLQGITARDGNILARRNSCPWRWTEIIFFRPNRSDFRVPLLVQYDGPVGVARPLRVFHDAVRGPAHRVQGLDEVAAAVGRLEFLDHLWPHAGHDAHRAHHVRRVGELHAHLGVRRVQRAHAERYHVHGPALHAPGEPVGDRPVRVRGTHPVAQLPLGRSPRHVNRVPAVLRAYERLALDPGHVPGAAPRQKAVRRRRKKKNKCSASTTTVYITS